MRDFFYWQCVCMMDCILRCVCCQLYCVMFVYVRMSDYFPLQMLLKVFIRESTSKMQIIVKFLGACVRNYTKQTEIAIVVNDLCVLYILSATMS